MIVIVGAGLAGLVCAKELLRRGHDDFLLLEAEAEPGGRVRSRVTPEGFTLDRGFQVLLDSYPAVRRHLNLAALEPRYFASGAILCDAGRRWVVAHPLRHPSALLQSALGDAFPFADRVRLAALAAELLLTPDNALLAETRSQRDVSMAHYLFMRGFSRTMVERFFRPFFGGVLLDDQLFTSAGLFRYYLKKFAAGRALLPARGMGAITRQLAAALPDDALRLNCRIERIETDASNRRAKAVVTAGGERIPCEYLVLATEAPASARLLGQLEDAEKASRNALGSTTLYFSSMAPLYSQPLLALPTGRLRRVRDFAQLTNVAPEYAPADQHLLSASVLHRRGLADEALAAAVKDEIAAIFPAAARGLRFIAAVEVSYSQHPHPAGFARALPPAPGPTPLDNVWLAGDQTAACSIQTTMESGERAAKFLMRTPGVQAAVNH